VVGLSLHEHPECFAVTGQDARDRSLNIRVVARDGLGGEALDGLDDSGSRWFKVSPTAVRANAVGPG
jgi:hypothetical protein